MRVVIFAGGLGTRLSEETEARPKPMVEIGGKPILWHILKIYASQGFKEFIICLGYKGYMIKEYFFNYYMHNSDLQINLENNDIKVLGSHSESFKVSLIETGLYTKTAGRLKRIKEHLGDDENFMLTYGDGLSNVNLKALNDFHVRHGKVATLTSIQPEGRFGGIEIDHHRVESFIEKPRGDHKWINGGYFVLNKKIFDYLPENSDDIMLETLPMDMLVENKELMAFKHHGFWKCMDALRDKIVLEELWASGNAKWKIWD